MPPVSHVVPYAPISTLGAFARLARRRGTFWLDSSLQRAGDGRYSMMGCEPRWEFSAHGEAWKVAHCTGVESSGTMGALARIEELLADGAVVASPGSPVLPFQGGAVGWLSYDLGRQFERFGSADPPQAGPADVFLAWYDAGIVWDHELNQVWIVGCDGARDGREAIREFVGWLETPAEPIVAPPIGQRGRATSNISRSEFMRKVEEVRDGIARGEFYQLNLVQRFRCSLTDKPPVAYLRLRDINPAPFAAYISTGEYQVMSSSPERFVEVSESGRIRTCPIKGTRPRGSTAALDERNRSDLLASEKERAELLMIVDLLRNDLGRICKPGSVEVARLHAVESYSAVHHLVGEIQGQLRPDVRWRDLLRAVFPGGSITGAPKVSAMRAIDRLEPDRRGIAMGSLGYFSAHGRIDLNIAIRTIVCDRDTAEIAVGAGIVWDSNPQAEYEETLAKGRPLFAALGVEPITE